MTLDTLVALLVVALATLYLLGRARRVLAPAPSRSPGGGAACGGCAKGCVSPDAIREALRSR